MCSCTVPTALASSRATSTPDPSHQDVALVTRYHSRLPTRDFEGPRQNLPSLILDIPETGGCQGMGRDGMGRERRIPGKSQMRMAGQSQTTGR